MPSIINYQMNALGSIPLGGGQASSTPIVIAANQEIWVHQSCVYFNSVGGTPQFVFEFLLGATPVFRYQIASTGMGSHPIYFKPPNKAVWRDALQTPGDFTARITNLAAGNAIYSTDVWFQVRLKNPHA